MNQHTNAELIELSNLPLARKIAITQTRLLEFCTKTNAYLSFSGGKDSTILMYILKQMADKQIIKMPPIVYIDSYYVYPSEREWIKKQNDIIILKSKMTPKEVLAKYGYPVISKQISSLVYKYNHATTPEKQNNYLYGYGKYHEKKRFSIPQKYHFLIKAPFKISDKCCFCLKKSVGDNYAKTNNLSRITGMTTEESAQRQKHWLRYGCNSFGKTNNSMPLAFWREQDILEYIYAENIELAPAYGNIIYKNGLYQTTGIKRNGCCFCLFGAHNPDDKRFYYLKELAPKMYNFCMETLGFANIMDWIQRSSNLRYSLPDGRLDRQLCLKL